jgi:hypothetical protein
MSPEQWNKMVSLFHAACEKTGQERVALLDSVGSSDPVLRLALERMLEDDKSSTSFFDRPAIEKLTVLNGSQTTPAEVGARFGRYELLHPIGCGGMGEVWAAHDTELDRPVALKFLFPALGRVAERLTREAKAASALNHPHIVTVYEVVWHEDTPIIVMELVDGRALRALSGTPQPVERVVDIGLQTAKALAAAHAHGVVHCDIKPENILVRNDGYVKVLDFGLARRVEGEPMVAGIGGTLRYMSPEQARGEEPTPASDIFSFGLVLYELASGRHAFPRGSAAETMQAILSERAAAPSSKNPLVLPPLDSLILSMLAHKPAARPSGEEVARTLREMQASAAGAHTRRGKWIAAAVCVLAACIALVWLWAPRTAAEKPPAFYQVTTLVPENRATAAAISPDGTVAAYANVDGIFLRSMGDGSTKTLGAPDDFTVDHLAWFPDQKNLIASGFSNLTYVPGLWLVSATGAPPRLLRTRAREGAPSPDGKQIAFVSQDWSELWVMGANGLQPRRLIDADKDVLPVVFWLPKGRLGFQRFHIYIGKYIRSYESLALDAGRPVTLVRDLAMSSASMLPDGRLVYLRWDNPDNSSSQQLWEVKTDPLTGAFLGKPRKIAALAGDNTTLLDLTVSADGKRAMVIRRSDQNTIFVGDFNEDPPRITNTHKLTLDERTNYPHAWTADSRAVIFESNRNGNFDLFKQDIDRRTPETVVATPLTEILAQLSPDGRFVLYAASPRGNQQPWFYKAGTYKLMRVPVDGGTPAEVPIGGMLDEFRCALNPGARCVLRITVSGRYRTYYDLDPIRGKGRELARTKWMPGVLGDWDISPDGKYVALPNHDPRDARIRIVALEPGPNEPREPEVVLPGLANLRGLVWAASGKAWFVSVDTTVGHRLLYVYLDGRYRSLGDIQGWAVPSPDGRHVAFMDRIVATNAWAVDRR